MCGLFVCAIVVLGMDAPVAVATCVGVLMGAIAHFGCSLAMMKTPKR
jgi:hypothetical protein